MKIVSWFSCGNNSAVASRMAREVYPDAEIAIVRCVVANEHEDNDRFQADCEPWFGQQVLRLNNPEYADCWEVWEKRRYISGIKGAPCTGEMKKVPRWNFERDWQPDAQIFGYSYDEQDRAEQFREQNPDVTLLCPLIDAGITKAMCAELVAGAGIRAPIMYGLGFRNNNCICCAKATSIIYWCRCRHHFPAQFERMAELSRRIGCRLTRIKGVRVFLDEIPLDYPWERKPDRQLSFDCGVLCAA
jgi:hypothetical protein